ncbi:unnamed protein product [Closterium sp. NIES-54]
MHSLLVSGLPRSLPPLPPLPALPCLPCVEGWQRAAPHSSSFPPTTAPLQTLHMDVWGPACVSGQSRECYFLLVVDDYTWYTTVFPLRSKSQVVDVLLPWIRTVRLQLHERFGQDLLVLRLHSDRGVMEIACTSMIHAVAPHFLWPFVVWYAAHQLNLWPRVTLPETSPTLRWMGEVNNASVFRDVMFDELVPFYRLFSYRSAPPPPPPLFLAPGPPQVDPLPPQGPAPSGVSQVDPLPGPALVQVAIDSGAARGAASGGAEPGGVESEGAETGGSEPGGVETGDAEPGGHCGRGHRYGLRGEVSCLRLVWGAEPGGVATRGAEPEGVEPGGAEPGGVASEGAECGGAEPQGAASSGECAGALPRLSPQQLRKWFVRHPSFGVELLALLLELVLLEGAGSGDPTESGDTSAGGSNAGGAGAGGAGVGGPGVGGARVGGMVLFLVPRLLLPLLLPSCVPRLTSRSRRYSRPLHCLLLLLKLRSLAVLQSVVSLRLVLSRLFALLVALLVCVLLLSLARTLCPFVLPLFLYAFLSQLFAVSDPSFESATASALVAELLDFVAACRLDYATALVAESASASPPSVGAMDAETASWKSTGTYVDEVPPPGANIVDDMWIFRVKRPPGSPPVFKARYVARSFSQRQGVDYFQTFSPTRTMTTLRGLLHVASQRDYELHSLDFSTAFLQGSLHEEIWLHRPPGFTESFPAGTQWSLRRPVYGLRQAPREWHDTLRTALAALGFALASADPSLFLRTDTSLPPFFVLVYVDDLIIATADSEALTLMKPELQKGYTCTDVGELHSHLGLQITRDRARRTITLTQSHMAHPVLQRFGFQFSSPQPTPLSTSHLLSAPPSDESVELSGPYPELVGCLMYVMTCTRPNLAYPLSLLARYVALGRHQKVHWDAAKRVLRYLCSTSGMGLVLGGRGPVVLTGHADASWVDDPATQRSSQGYTFSLGSGSVSWWSTRSYSVLSSSCEAEIYAGAMATQELRWLTYLLTDLGE